MVAVVRTGLFYLLLALWTLFISCVVILFAWMVTRDKRHHRFVQPYGRGVMRLCSWICGVHYRVRGREHIPAVSAVVAANHQSTWETFFLQTLLTPQAQVVKKELMSIPFFGWAFHLLCAIPIDRSNPKKALIKIIQESSQYLTQGFWVLVFPEGTRRPVGSPGRFTQGAAAMATRANKPILPIAHNAGRCWPGRAWIKHPGIIDVVIGPLISIEGKSSKQITTEAEHWIHTTLAEIDPPSVSMVEPTSETTAS
ncbi:lysophospholipid acyltransferase family protein [Aestuariirhabdus litorea]|uniref:1-acyl-sn-glycerol-3-phosphate acyltransferase n=1 Tax=Aestuariirhabdus litorea TaxID=2528527 RepID=A0A3P3VLI4_9GAMM|nr:lysophospholipid acyltransferase family protein [Aestuariirhabdus litorea]RRJ82589.1 1-acyl-sn-glycerol-3-phosphate acyltransferase [Aestuariirhabdus litorea]RWW92748.1 1-acyl-sn-glycerol-3-phosphate acyltransferase [Endozoicomonadaceae bacterium GTF-13]